MNRKMCQLILTLLKGTFKIQRIYKTKKRYLCMRLNGLNDKFHFQTQNSCGPDTSLYTQINFVICHHVALEGGRKGSHAYKMGSTMCENYSTLGHPNICCPVSLCCVKASIFIADGPIGCYKLSQMDPNCA